MIKTDQMGQALQNIFGETANEVARETRFVQRESKLSGIKFMQTFVLGFVQHPEASLNLLCQVAADLGVENTKQGLQKRLSSAAVAYMQAMFDRSKDTLQNKVPLPHQRAGQSRDRDSRPPSSRLVAIAGADSVPQYPPHRPAAR